MVFSWSVVEGTRTFVHRGARVNPAEPPMNASVAPLPLLHADAALVCIDKPAGLRSVPGRGEHKRDCAALRVQAAFADARVVHRLDEATSGLLLFARGAAVQRHLSAAFAERLVDKRYVAVVHGRVADDAGEIDLPLAADWPNRPRQQVDHAHGKASLTRWRVLERGDATTRLELEPLTGRSHQLRVHLQAIGHPIVGDALYAARDVVNAAPRLLLHASALTFAHPLTERPLALHSAAPF
jgi:tRNA pseudouridine32 synthase/23S rRNA pseudouridine746 synthase